MNEEVSRRIQHTDFSVKALEELVVSILLSPYAESGGSEIGVIAINYENDLIRFETRTGLITEEKILDLIATYRTVGVETATVEIENTSIVFYSGNGGNEWVAFVGDNIGFIHKVIENVWYSIFEH